jgi:tetratricopeptide (TPR) repeat protein
MATKEEIYDEAIVLQQEGKLAEAIGKLETLVGEEPDYALAHAAMSVFYNKLEEYDKSVQHGRRVCQLEPDDPFSFVAMSLMCQKAGKIEEAEQALLQARQVEFAARRDSAT